jgi:hypothetical protein
MSNHVLSSSRSMQPLLVDGLNQLTCLDLSSRHVV